MVWGSSDFVAGVKSKDRPAPAVVGWSQAIGLLVISVVVLLSSPHFADGPWPVWAMAAGLGGAWGLVCFYTALSTGTMGVVAPIASLGVVVPLTLGVLAGETPGWLTWCGIVLAILGVLLASGPEFGSGVVARRPVLLACAAGVGFGIALYSLDRGGEYSVVSTLWGMRLTSVTCFALAALVLRRTGGVTRADLPALTFVGVADLAANGMFAYASAHGYVSVASVLGSLYPVVTAVLAYVVLKERLRPIQLGGAVATVAGVALIAAGG